VIQQRLFAPVEVHTAHGHGHYFGARSFVATRHFLVASVFARPDQKSRPERPFRNDETVTHADIVKCACFAKLRRPRSCSGSLVVWLASFPRSGNSFLRMALERLHGRPTYSLYDDDPAPARHRLKALRESPQVHFIKTHELPADDSPAILLMRDGRDAMVSFAHFIEDYGVAPRTGLDRLLFQIDTFRQRLLYRRSRFDLILRRVIENEYFDWSAHYRAWRHRRPGCHVVNFESLVRKPADTVAASLTALNIGLVQSEERLPEFRELHAQDPRFFRDGRTGQWRHEMRPELEDLFWRRHREAMVDAGYTR
jgi:hypothetical protein